MIIKLLLNQFFSGCVYAWSCRELSFATSCAACTAATCVASWSDELLSQLLLKLLSQQASQLVCRLCSHGQQSLRSRRIDPARCAASYRSSHLPLALAGGPMLQLCREPCGAQVDCSNFSGLRELFLAYSQLSSQLA